MFAHNNTDLFRVPDNGSSLCRRVYKDTSSLPSYGYDHESQTFFSVSRTGTDVTLTAVSPTAPLLEWWLGEYGCPSSRYQAVSRLAQGFGFVDQSIRDAAVALLSSKIQLTLP